jgi:hypothetical protein
VLGAARGELGSTEPSTFSLESILAWLYLGIFGTLVAFTAYTWLLGNAPISKVVTHQYVNPIVAILLGALLLGEEITLAVGAGAALIVGSVFVAVRSENAETRRASGLADSGASLAARGPAEQYGGTGRRLERRERSEAAPEAGSAGAEGRPARIR